jgi:4'-phosphopantetheinyl transferase
MEIYWLEQSATNVPSDDNWLSKGELRTLSALRFAKRRADWRLGRWTAKQALSVCLNLPRGSQTLTRIEIRAAPSGAPEAFLAAAPAQVTISLSHSRSRAVCAIAHGKIELGCDLETIEPRDESFVRDYFTEGEQEWIQRAPAAARAALVTLLWSAKESALKALGTGLRADTRSLTVCPTVQAFDALTAGFPVRQMAAEQGLEVNWQLLQVRSTGGQDFCGWWSCENDLIRTLVAAPRPDRPILLGASSS